MTTKWPKAVIDDLKRRARLDDVVRASGYEVTKDGKDLLVLCPFHDDSTPSLSLAPDKDGGVYRCRACQAKGDVIEWTMKVRSLSFPKAVRALASEYGVELSEQRSADPTERKRVATYRYTDAAGELLYTIERWEPGKNGRSKDFVQRLADGKPGKSPRQVPYNLPALQEARRADQLIFVVEGEKCADALIALGLPATTHAGGTGSSKTWEDEEFIRYFETAKVVILPDHDGPGAKHAEHVAQTLFGWAAEVRVLDLPLTEKGADVVDWLAAGGTRERLLAMAAEASAWRSDDGSWRAQLTYGDRGLKSTPGNALLILENDASLRGLLAWDEHALRVVVTGRPPWESWGPYPRAFDDDDVLRACAWIEGAYRVAFPIDTLGRTFYSASRRHPIDPVVDWLKALRWDGAPRLDTWLSTYLGAEDGELQRELGLRWLLSAVARATRPGCKVDHVLVLEGPQGARKSSALRVLGGPWYSDGLESMEGKDALMSIGLAWIVEIPELDAMSKSEVARVKAFITRQVDRFRPPYGRTTKEAPRRCVFAGTTNEDAYLQDATGNRRFWPVRCGRIDLEALERDREQLWAEARVRLDAGEHWWVDDAALEGLLREEQDARMQVDPWEPVIEAWAEGREYVTTRDALMQVGLEKQHQDRRHSMRIGGIFKRLGFTAKRRPGNKTREWRYFKPSYDLFGTVQPAEVGREVGPEKPATGAAPSNRPTRPTSFPHVGARAGVTPDSLQEHPHTRGEVGRLGRLDGEEERREKTDGYDRPTSVQPPSVVGRSQQVEVEYIDDTGLDDEDFQW